MPAPMTVPIATPTHAPATIEARTETAANRPRTAWVLAATGRSTGSLIRRPRRRSRRRIGRRTRGIDIGRRRIAFFIVDPAAAEWADDDPVRRAARAGRARS